MEKCKTLMPRGILPKRQTQIHILNESRHKNKRSHEASRKLTHLNAEEDSIWLYDVLDTIGVNGYYKEQHRHRGIMCEILESFQNDVSTYYMGSSIEGTTTPGDSSDIDFMRCVDKHPVLEQISNTQNMSFLIVRESDTAAGYVKLQLVVGGIQYTSRDWLTLQLFPDMKSCFKIDKMNRIVLFACTLSGNPKLFVRPINKPADTTTGQISVLNADDVKSYRCKTWPTMANEWLIRDRTYGWPHEKTIEKLKSLGFFVVRKGHPFSSEIDLEWRISLSLQERELMFNLNDVQHKCYIILKMFNREVIDMTGITTYHWKTCLFYVIEENDRNIWEKNLLLRCIELCIRQMLKWVKCGFCPNYFIPGENLFDGRLNSSSQLISENILEEMLNLGFDCLLMVKTNNICDYIMSRGSPANLEWLKVNSKIKQWRNLSSTCLLIPQTALSAFNHEILEYNYLQANNEQIDFIKSLWLTLYNIQHTVNNSTTAHRTKEKQDALYLLLPSIHTCLASNISAMALQTTNPHIRDFLLLGSFMYFMNGDSTGCLKFISVLYAAGLYNDCEWWLDKLEKENIKDNPSLCRCRYSWDDLQLAVQNIIKISPEHRHGISTCVSFLPTELLITPDAMKYEMFKYVGISLDENERANVFGRWHYRAVVDSNVYFYLLKNVVKRKLKKIIECINAQLNIADFLLGTNVRHRDVALNVLAWMYCLESKYAFAIFIISKSWRIMSKTDVCLMITDDTMKQKQYLYNAAKIHALVIIYNTWFLKKPSKFHVCFHCICDILVKLKKCSGCKVSTYCCKACQKKDWKYHKAACKIVREYKQY